MLDTLRGYVGGMEYVGGGRGGGGKLGRGGRWSPLDERVRSSFAAQI